MRSSKSISNFPAVLANFVVVLLIISQVHSEQNTFVIHKAFRTAKFSFIANLNELYLEQQWWLGIRNSMLTISLTELNLYDGKSHCFIPRENYLVFIQRVEI